MEIINDSAARQEAIYSDSDELLVEAGAGTGKTSVLVSKIVHLIRDCQTRIQNIAAITFTESSAQELSERIRRELEAELRRSGTNKELSMALFELEQGAITTIHGFAQSLLMRYGHKIGLPLNFSIADESMTKYRLKSKLTNVIYEMLSDHDRQAIFVLAQSLGLTDYHFNELWQLCNENWYLFGNESLDSNSVKYFTEDRLSHSMTEKIKEITSLADSCYSSAGSCIDGNDKLLLLIKSLYKWSIILDDKPGLSEALEWISLISDPKPNKKGNKKNWPGIDINYLRGNIETISALRKEILQVSLDSILPILIQHFAEKAKEVSYQRKLSGELRFQDLLVYCRELLMLNDDIREKIILQYHYILVDEFQDTDQIQLDILNFLSSKANSMGSKLFYVGDPKQSIYRFRGADIGLYRKVRYQVSGNTPLEITTNFRSRPKILDAVNTIFTNLLQANGDIIQTKDIIDSEINSPEEYLKFHPLVPARKEADGGSNVIFLGGPAPEDLNISARRYLESQKIVTSIKQAVETPWLVEDQGQIRPAMLRDIAVIIPRRTGLLELQNSLKKANIAYSLPSSELVFSNLLVQDLILCLKAIVFPYRQYYLMAALRSIVFGCSDIDLVQFELSGGQWTCGGITEPTFARYGLREGNFAAGARSDLDGVAKVHSALQEIYTLHNLMHEEGIIFMLSKLVDISNLYAIAKISKDPLQSVTALDYIIDKILAYCKKNNTSSYELVDFIEAEKANYPRAELFKEALENSNSINIVTIHGSKGLEYPICIIAELGSATVSRERPTIIFANDTTEREKKISIKVNEQIKTSGYDDLSDRYGNLERAELYRLCYVAFTRARDHLVVMLDHKASFGSNPSLAQVLYEIVSADSNLSTLMHQSQNDTYPVENDVVEPNDTKASESKKTFNQDMYFAWQNLHDAYREQKNKINPVKLECVHLLPDPGNLDAFNAVLEKSSLLETDLHIRERNIATRGQDAFDTAISNTLKRLMLCGVDAIGEEGIEKLLFYNEENQYFSHDRAEMIDCVSRCLREHLYIHLEGATKIFTEIPIIFEAEGLIFEGEIDIYSQGSDGSVVFDCGELTRYFMRPYQSASISDRWSDNYNNYIRMGAYALGLKQLGVNVKKYVMLYSQREKDYSSIVFEDVDTLIGFFRSAIPYLGERL